LDSVPLSRRAMFSWWRTQINGTSTVSSLPGEVPYVPNDRLIIPA